MRNLFCRLFFIITLLSPLTAQAIEETRYVWLTQGKPTGEQIVHREGNKITIRFHYNDRGRGPDTTTHITLNDQGLITSLDISGLNYSKGKVDEHFSRQDGRVTWRSATDSGDEENDVNRHYLSVDGPPYMMGLLAKAAWMAPHERIKLYPQGEVHVQQVAQIRLRDGKKITLHQLHGLNISPISVWLDEEMNYFGVDEDIMAIVPAGYEATRIPMAQQQIAATAHFQEGLINATVTQQQSGLLIRNARLFDSKTATLSTPSDVLVDGKGRIKDIGPHGSIENTSARILDAKGQILMPTLIDMHSHYGEDAFLHLLSAGVTGVRNMGGGFATLKRLIKGVQSGALLGPEVYPMGIIDGKGPFSAPVDFLPETLEQAKGMVDDYQAAGFIGIKIYSSLPPEWTKPLADYAHSKDMLVQGHIPSGLSAEDAVNAGYNEITHFNMVMLNFLGARNLDTRTPQRFIVPGKQGKDIDMGGKAFQDFIALLQQKHISLDPTLSIHLNTFYAEPGTIKYIARPYADHLPASARRTQIQTPTYNAGFEDAFRRSGEKAEHMLKALYDAGLQIFPGTDQDFPGFALISEMMTYERIGIPAPHILKMATLDAATRLRVGDDIGSIEVGKRAHMMLVKGDPTKHIADLYQATTVIKDTAIIDAQALRAGMGITPWQ